MRVNATQPLEYLFSEHCGALQGDPTTSALKGHVLDPNVVGAEVGETLGNAVGRVGSGVGDLLGKRVGATEGRGVGSRVG
mmetsp:Transcript_29796/g.47442  ORF Transcript_29796/g.47442 Transcript_29796/m.47442 type:complete len:80 (+) Transcript_29796:89-328(+)